MQYAITPNGKAAYFVKGGHLAHAAFRDRRQSVNKLGRLPAWAVIAAMA